VIGFFYGTSLRNNDNRKKGKEILGNKKLKNAQYHS